MTRPLFAGMDVGSTTVKTVVVDESNKVLFKRYERHNTRQAATVRAFIADLQQRFAPHPLSFYITGSGGRAIAPLINGCYVQEVNAVTYAVETRFPDAGSVIELGGQDAKVIIWKEDDQGRTSTLPQGERISFQRIT